MGPARAAEILYAGRLFTGAEAAEMGLVNRAVEPDAVLETTHQMAREFADSAPLAVRGVKQALARSLDASLEDQLSFEAPDIGPQKIVITEGYVRERLEEVLAQEDLSRYIL